MFSKKYLLVWSYEKKSRHVFELLFNTYEEAEEHVRKHLKRTVYYDIEEILFT